MLRQVRNVGGYVVVVMVVVVVLVLEVNAAIATRVKTRVAATLATIMSRREGKGRRVRGRVR